MTSARSTPPQKDHCEMRNRCQRQCYGCKVYATNARLRLIYERMGRQWRLV